MDPVVHFEMPYEDRQRMADFYTKAFGWKTEMLGAEMGDYVTAQTSETDEKGFPKKPGMINGGFYKKGEDLALQIPSVVVAVENIQDAMERVKQAGGTLIGEPMDIPGIGSFIALVDTEGNRVSMLQPLPM